MEGQRTFNIEKVDLPWSIRHVNLLLVVSILLFAIVIIAFLFTINYWPCLSLGIISLIIFSLVLSEYSQANRYAEIVYILYKELISVEIEKSGLLKYGKLKLRTQGHGEFSLLYYPGHGHQRTGGGANYKLWISTGKTIPALAGEKHYIWVRPTLISHKYKANPLMAKYLPKTQLENISTLHRIQFEVINGENRIVAIFRDIPLLSETKDIVKTLQILRYIESIL